MLTEDYLMRYIRIATAVLAQLVGLKAAGLEQDALFLIDRTLEQMLGLRIDIIRSLSSRDLLAMLADQDRTEPAYLSVLGDLFSEESVLLSHLEREIDSRGSASAAMALYIESEFNNPLEEDSSGVKVEPLLAAMEPAWLSDDMLFTLFSYFEHTGKMGEALTWLEELIDRTGGPADLIALAREFIGKLAAAPQSDLDRWCLTPADLQAALIRIEGRR